MTILFWCLLGLILFSLVGYGLIWSVLAWFMPERPLPTPVPQKAVMLIAARNEAADIGAKIASVLAQDTGPHSLEILVVSDGSDDGTEAAALNAAKGDPRLRVLCQAQHRGKAAALNLGLAHIASDRVVIFSDANSLLVPGAVRALLDPLAHPLTGGSIGQLQIPAGNGLMARAERMFWRYDNGLKRAEHRIGGVVSAQGTLYALRRKLIPMVPADMADDLANSLAVVAAGQRLAFAPGAEAVEHVSENHGAEFGRRVRSTERGWRGLMRYRGLMNPAKTGVYAVQLICHKLLRRLVAFALPLLLVVNLGLIGHGLVYDLALAVQLAIYGLAVLALCWSPARKIPGASATVMFTLGHAAIAWAIIRYYAGVRTATWTPVRDQP